MVKFEIEKRPHPIQEKYLRCPADEILYGGALGGGKSFAAVLEAYIECMRTPGLVVGLFRKTLPELTNTLIREALQLYPQGSYVFKEAKRRLTFKNGSEVRFNYIDTDKDLVQYQGQEFDMIIMDEAGSFTEYQLIMIKERVRTSKLGVKTKVRYLSNPRGAGKGYLKRRFIEDKEPFTLYPTPETIDLPVEERRYLCYIPAKIQDNPSLFKNDPTYVNGLKEMSDEEYNALVLGDWDSKLGTFFPEFDRKVHVIEDYIPDVDHDYCFIACDWGSEKPFAVLWGAIKSNGQCIIYREFYGWTGKPNVGLKLSSKVVAQRILDMTPVKENIKYMVLDAACWIKSGHTVSIYEIMQEVLMERRIPIIRSLKNRINGFENVKAWMEPNKVHEDKPSLLMTRKCYNLTRTIPDMVYANNGLDMDSSLEDHCSDALSYLLATRPMRKRKPRTPYRKDQWGYMMDKRYRLDN